MAQRENRGMVELLDSGLDWKTGDCLLIYELDLHEKICIFHEGSLQEGILCVSS